MSSKELADMYANEFTRVQDVYDAIETAVQATTRLDPARMAARVESSRNKRYLPIRYIAPESERSESS